MANEDHTNGKGELPDGTLGGYLSIHERPPSFEGPDGHPYTVSIEIESQGDLRAPYVGYLVFPRWAQTGLGVVGHVQTPTLVEGRHRIHVEEALGRLQLVHVKELLNDAIRQQTADLSDD
ncbi:MAG: hypothetical protein R3E98_17930 [Gemmatimonadota bacterium]|nr:hypothetical protein [Gemmatimonadota bacterium]